MKRAAFFGYFINRLTSSHIKLALRGRFNLHQIFLSSIFWENFDAAGKIFVEYNSLGLETFLLKAKHWNHSLSVDCVHRNDCVLVANDIQWDSAIAIFVGILKEAHDSECTV